MESEWIKRIIFCQIICGALYYKSLCTYSSALLNKICFAQFCAVSGTIKNESLSSLVRFLGLLFVRRNPSMTYLKTSWAVICQFWLRETDVRANV